LTLTCQSLLDMLEWQFICMTVWTYIAVILKEYTTVVTTKKTIKVKLWTLIVDWYVYTYHTDFLHLFLWVCKIFNFKNDHDVS